MNIEENLYEKTLVHFATLYLLLGVIERRLRQRIPITLREYGESFGQSIWWLVLPENPVQRVRIVRAIKKNNGILENFERFLTLRFWRDIFSGKCYRNLWRPALHRVFNGLPNSLDSQSYGKVVFHLNQAVEIRNRVAHYDETNASSFDREEELLLWLVNALGSFNEKTS